MGEVINPGDGAGEQSSGADISAIKAEPPPLPRTFVKHFVFEPEPPPKPWDADTFQTRRRLWAEVGVVLCLAVIPDILNALSAALTVDHERETIGSARFTVGIIVRCLVVTVPMLYIMAKSGEPWSVFGFRRMRWGIDVPLGVAILVAAYIAGYVVMIPAYQLAWMAELTELFDRPASGKWTEPQHAGQWVGIVIVALFNGFSEELVMRGYLMGRLERLLRSPMKALLATSLLWGAYHIYYGVFGAAQVAIYGLVAGAAYLMTRRIWPLVVYHVLGDIVPSLMWIAWGSGNAPGN